MNETKLSMGASAVHAAPDCSADPDDCAARGVWQVEPFYYSTAANGGGGGGGGGTSTRPLRRGKAYRCVETDDIVCFQDGRGVTYRVGDTVYLDSQQADLPYFLCGIQGFKMTKREQLHVKVNWYYRHSEVPETVYHTLVQDRHTEHSQRESDNDLCIKNPAIRARELFISDAQDVYHISALRGKCDIRHFKDIGAAQEFAPADDNFFYILGYNPQNNRLASIQGEIRVGPSHQAKLPECRERGLAADDGPRETLVWKCDRLADSDLLVFLRASRSMAAFAGICSSAGTADEGCQAAFSDATTIAAMRSLHSRDYKCGDALQSLVDSKCGQKGADDAKWADDETKRFIKGIKQWGKNFFRIRKELLPHRATGELVEFYYLWKKTPGASNQRPRQRQRRPPTNILRRVKPSNGNGGNGNGGKASSRPPSNEFLDFSSASENEVEESDSDTRDLAGYACHHCYSIVSKDWHHAGKDRALLCTDCRVYFKKYGDLRPVDRPRTPPPYLFRPVKEEVEFYDDFGLPGVRTRAGKASAVKLQDLLCNSGRGTPTPTAELERKSPSASSTSSTGSGAPNEERRGARKPGAGSHKKRRAKRAAAGAGGPSAQKRLKRSSTNQSDESDAAGSATSAPSSPKADGAAAAASDDAPVVALPRFSPRLKSPPMRGAVVRPTPIDLRDDVEGRQKAVDAAAATTSIEQPLPATANAVHIPKAPASVITVNMMSAIKTEPEDIDKENYGDAPSRKEPEPRLVDELFCSSSNAIFRRHWDRGENSCARTDLVYSAKSKQTTAPIQPKLEKMDSSTQQFLPNRAGASSVMTPQMVSPQLPVAPPLLQHNPFIGMPPGFAQQQQQQQQHQEDLPALQRLRAYAEYAEHVNRQNAMATDAAVQQRVLAGLHGEAEKQRLEAELRERQQQEQFKRSHAAASAGPPTPVPPTPGPPPGMSMPMAMQLDPRQVLELQHQLATGQFPMNLLNAHEAGVDPVALERLIYAEQIQQLERRATVDPMARMQLEQLGLHTHSHTHSHMHWHIHPSVQAAALANGINIHGPPADPFGAGGGLRPPMPANMTPHQMMAAQLGGALQMGIDPNALMQMDPARFAAVAAAQQQQQQQLGADAFAGERLRQEQLQRQLMLERSQFNEMMRRLQQEGAAAAAACDPATSSAMLRPSL